VFLKHERNRRDDLQPVPLVVFEKTALFTASKAQTLEGFADSPESAKKQTDDVVRGCSTLASKAGVLIDFVR